MSAPPSRCASRGALRRCSGVLPAAEVTCADFIETRHLQGFTRWSYTASGQGESLAKMATPALTRLESLLAARRLDGTLARSDRRHAGSRWPTTGIASLDASLKGGGRGGNLRSSRRSFFRPRQRADGHARGRHRARGTGGARGRVRSCGSGDGWPRPAWCCRRCCGCAARRSPPRPGIRCRPPSFTRFARAI